MNRGALAGSLFAAGCGVFTGVLLSFGEAERRALKKYAGYEESLKRAYEMALAHEVAFTTDHKVDGPHEQEYEELTGDQGPLPRDVKIEIGPPGLASAGGDDEEVPDVPEYINHYQRALDAKETPVEQFVSGGVNDYGVSYIEEEEYEEDDGRFKGQITIVMTEHSPSFFMDGMEIKDWDERVGDSILVDFYQLVPPNAPPFLYVRNHKRDEDYEVTREIP